MCIGKVANPRERVSRGGHGESRIMTTTLEPLVSPMFSGLHREQEMSVMVSALTDVLAGNDRRRPHPTNEGVAGAGENPHHRHFLESSSSSVDTVCSSYQNFSIAGTTASNTAAYSGILHNTKIKDRLNPPHILNSFLFY